MTDESSSTSYLSVAMTTTGMTQNTGGNTVVPSSPDTKRGDHLRDGGFKTAQETGADFLQECPRLFHQFFTRTTLC